MNPLSFLAGNGFTFDANSNTTTPLPLWITHWIQSIVSRIWKGIGVYKDLYQYI